jgi:hypothetical protein
MGDQSPGLPAQLFSPAKMIYIAYILGIWWNKLSVSYLSFWLISILFLAVEIGHNDYFRLLLNRRAESKGIRDHQNRVGGHLGH